ncbi:MAG: exosortase system-associated protein, TIGR04073 family [Methylobacter sp.]
MRKFSRSFAFVLCSGLFAAYAPATLADMSTSGYGGVAAMPSARVNQTRHRSYGEKVGGKAANAFVNLVSAPLEIPKNMINTSNKSNVFYGIVGGLFKGVINTAGRLGVGVADLITIPLPTLPIAQPAYIWDDFDVDTSYGPAFRLDKTPEDEPAVQAPAPAPVVAAPAAPEPKPQPIDNSRQYKEETNHQLDEMFKKEMKK